MTPNQFRRIALAQGLLPEAVAPQAKPPERDQERQPPGRSQDRDAEGRPA